MLRIYCRQLCAIVSYIACIRLVSPAFFNTVVVSVGVVAVLLYCRLYFHVAREFDVCSPSVGRG